jgi:hypothetical protein
MGRFDLNRQRILLEEFEDETILVHIKSCFYYSLSKSGTQILRRLTDGWSLDEIVRLYAGVETESRVRDQIEAFVQQLLGEDLIVPLHAETPGRRQEDQPWSAQAPESFERPVLARFDDVKELLLIDPIHEIDPDYGWPKASPSLRGDQAEPYERQHSQP